MSGIVASAQDGVRLDELARAGFDLAVRGDGTVQVRGVQHDSRAVNPGDLFVAVNGARTDGATFAADAVARGAVAVLAERALDLGVPQLITRDARRALARVSAFVYGDPTTQLSVVGVTGTNGKTTTAWLLDAAISAAGGQPALLGTVATRHPGSGVASSPPPGAPAFASRSSFTTPEGDDIARFARAALHGGATHLVMEVSSHALALHRVDAVRFRVAAFTNLTRDHLDFHGDLESYGAAKARLFEELSPENAVINVDDPFGARLAACCSTPALRCSRRPAAEAEVKALEFASGREGLRARVATPEGEVELVSPLVGTHNLENLLVALACGLASGFSAEAMARGLALATGVPGRLERVPHPDDVAVFVDYAHTPDALDRVLVALRPLTPGRLVVVFGCGGDRDRGKRPRMGRAAASRADRVVLTSDNPRTEDPATILAEMERGVLAEGLAPVSAAELRERTRAYTIIEDRSHAIRVALAAAQPGDTVLIAGKGHEDYQIVGTVKRPFDDRVEARRAIDAELEDAVGDGGSD